MCQKHSSEVHGHIFYSQLQMSASGFVPTLHVHVLALLCINILTKECVYSIFYEDISISVDHNANHPSPNLCIHNAIAKHNYFWNIRNI